MVLEAENGKRELDPTQTEEPRWSDKGFLLMWGWHFGRDEAASEEKEQ